MLLRGCVMKCQIFITINKQTIPQAWQAWYMTSYMLKLKSSSNLIPSTHLEGNGDDGRPVFSKLENISLCIFLSLKNNKNKNPLLILRSLHINISFTGTLPSFKLHLVLVGITQTTAAQQNNFSERVLATKLNAFRVQTVKYLSIKG